MCLIPAPVNGLRSVDFQTMEVLGRTSCVTTRSAHGAGGLYGRFRVTAPVVDCRRRGGRTDKRGLLRGITGNTGVTLIDSTKVPTVSSPNFSLMITTTRRGLAIIPLPNTGTTLAKLVTSNVSARPFCFCKFLGERGGLGGRRLRGLSGLSTAVVLCRTPRHLGRALSLVSSVVNGEGVTLYHRLAGECRRFVQKAMKRTVR